MTRVILGGLVWIVADVFLTIAMSACRASGMENPKIGVLAQAASLVDSNNGMSMTGLLSSFGTAIAVVASSASSRSSDWSTSGSLR